MLKLNRTSKSIKTRIQKYKNENNKQRLMIYSGFFALVLAGSSVALNQVLINMHETTKLTIKNAIDYATVMPIFISSGIGLYFNVDKLQTMNQEKPKQKVKKKSETVCTKQ
ncbi:MAG: hypothetical protein PHD02_02670 [Bacilli bacterium]|nr:hypothetical protein [Bacilli bacterium]